MTRRVAPETERGGFVLAIVVLMLFAIAVAGATGYQLASSEFTLSQQNRDGQEALAVARAGLQRFLGEQIGVVGDSVSYAIGEGVALVTARKVVERDSLNHLYYIESEGQVADARTPLLPAKRTVATYAWHRLNPIPLKAALLLSGGRLWVYGSSSVDGSDAATTADCPGGGTMGTAGIGTAGTVTSFGGTIVGSPAVQGYSSYNEVYDTVGIRWDILSDPDFPVEFDGTLPNFGALPADSFPLVRFNGNLTAWSAMSGRGVLIVTGRLLLLGGFTWDGIILAGRFYYAWGSGYSPPRVNGMLIGGLSYSNGSAYLFSSVLDYHSCNAYAANRALSYLEVVDHTLFEVNP